VGFSIAGHQPKKRRREGMLYLPFHEYHSMVRGQTLPQPIGGDHPADPTAEDYDSL
jgi:hypothetical protein